MPPSSLPTHGFFRTPGTKSKVQAAVPHMYNGICLLRAGRQPTTQENKDSPVPGHKCSMHLRRWPVTQATKGAAGFCSTKTIWGQPHDGVSYRLFQQTYPETLSSRSHSWACQGTQALQISSHSGCSPPTRGQWHPRVMQTHSILEEMLTCSYTKRQSKCKNATTIKLNYCH